MSNKVLEFWLKKKQAEGGQLKNSWYAKMYTDYFGIDSSFYRGKKILDIGCGPRGSLEWAKMAAERVGLDPLAKDYLQLGINQHQITYVAAKAESIPFEDNSFDVVSAFNTLESVKDLKAALAEIQRVLKPGGIFLVLGEVKPHQNPNSSIGFSWKISELLSPLFGMIEEQHYEIISGGMYAGLEQGKVYDHSNSTERSGVLAAVFYKVRSTPPLITKPKVSVIIPSYNNARYIGQAIESVLNQTYTNYEIIVVDDGSSDNTQNWLRPDREQIRYLYQTNQGSATARNLGIREAKGELIAFLDADDFWCRPEKLAEQVALFETHSALGCVQTGWSVVNQSAELLQDVKPWYSLPELNLETWLKNKPIRLSSMMIRWQWLEEVGGFDSEFRQSHDVDLVLRLSLKGCPFTWLRQVTTCYRQHPDNTTRNGMTQAQGLQAVLDKFFHRSDLPEPIRQMESQIRYTTLVWIAWHLYNTGYPAQMAQYLSKSLSYTSNFPAETISDWVASFARFAQERGDHFDADTFSDLREWQQLVMRW